MIRPQYAAGVLSRPGFFMVAGLLIGGSVWRRSRRQTDTAASPHWPC